MGGRDGEEGLVHWGNVMVSTRLPLASSSLKTMGGTTAWPIPSWASNHIVAKLSVSAVRCNVPSRSTNALLSTVGTNSGSRARRLATVPPPATRSGIPTRPTACSAIACDILGASASRAGSTLASTTSRLCCSRLEGDRRTCPSEGRTRRDCDRAHARETHL